MPPSRCARPRNGSRRAGTRLRRIAAVLVLCVSAQAGFSAEIFTLDGLRVTATGDIGPSSLRFDLVVIGDGYIADDFRPGGRWDRDSARLVKNFFERKEAVTQRAGFARELKADREFLRLQILLKDTRAIAGRPETIRKLVESFIKKHEGTCAAEKARSFVPAAQ